ncbi:MAG: AMP-binding protein [Lachnospiraceae bacterium]|nr:AMP-binding protein [Lachnospiraceae bacterium]
MRGKIILTGPSVMLGYLDNPEETAKTLKTLADGRTWLYTGDLDANPEVAYSCVIGVKDPRRMQRVRAYVVLADGVEGTEELKMELLGRLKKQLAAYAIPKEIIFRDTLPRTLVGKVAFRQLEDEANQEAEEQTDQKREG